MIQPGTIIFTHHSKALKWGRRVIEETEIRKYLDKDILQMIDIWNEIVIAGNTFPQTDTLNEQNARSFFGDQSFTGVVAIDDEIFGLYILHPNNIGRCAHIANASYGVKSGQRSKGYGEKLVIHSIKTAKELQFRILQFNAVTVTNEGALHLYKKLGFRRLGIIPGGFHSHNGGYIDIIPHYIELL